MEELTRLFVERGLGDPPFTVTRFNVFAGLGHFRNHFLIDGHAQRYQERYFIPGVGR